MRWRDRYETGDPYTPPHHKYVEHLNTLAQSGNARGPGVHTDEKAHLPRVVHPPLTDDERAELDTLFAELAHPTFDDLYRAHLERKANR